MKRTVIAAVLLLGTMVGTQAGRIDTYEDVIRPNGHKRSEAVLKADVDACYRQTGANPYRHAMPAFKKCMLAHGYRWLSVRNLPEPRTRVREPDTTHELLPTLSPPKPRAESGSSGDVCAKRAAVD